MKIIIFIAVMVNLKNIASVAGLAMDDYYWRDYDGRLPPDAFPGGTTEAGKPMYIGQLLFEQKIFPGKIYEHDAHVYIAWLGNEIKKAENGKILCTKNPEKLKWVAVRQETVALLDTNAMINAGFEPGYVTYIGRIHLGGENVVGRISCQSADLRCLGIFTSKHGKQVWTKDTEFEVLTYVNDHSKLPECQKRK